MDWLTKLLAPDAAANATLKSAELSFEQWLPWPVAVLLGLSLAALVVVLYFNEKGTIGPLRRLLAIGLRVGFFCILLLLLFPPRTRLEFEDGKRPRGVALLLDNSQSMKQQDRRLTEADQWRVALAKGLRPLKDGLGDTRSAPKLDPKDKDPARAKLVQWVLEHKELNLIEGLEKFGAVRPYLFGHRVRGVQDEPGKEKRTAAQTLLASFKTDDARTRLADAVYDILQRRDGDPPSAIVLISDGQDNASKFTLSEAALECRRHAVPLYIYGVGSAEGGSLQLREMAAPETLFGDDTVTIPLRWRAQGFAKGTLEIVLTLGGKEVVRKDLDLQSGEDLRHALSFTVPKGADKEESLPLTVTLQVKGNKDFKDSFTRQVRVVDRKIKVLYIEHVPRFEFRFLQPALSPLRDRRLEVQFLLVQADAKVAEGAGSPFIAKLPPTREKFFDAKYNVIILGDVAASYLGKDHLEWIKEFVENRGGLIVIAGPQHMPSSYEGSLFTELLPVEFVPHKFAVEADARTQEYPPTLTEAGKRSDMLSLADTPEESLKLWESLPGFHWQYPLTKLRPGAQSLIVNPRAKMGDQPMPILATQFYGKGQVVFLGTAETWRWRYNTQDKHFVRFWGQLIYQMGLPSLLGETTRRAQFALESSEAVLDKPGSIFVRLVDKDYNPRKDQTVDAIVVDAKPGQEKIWNYKLQAISDRPGDYRALLPHDRPGRFEIKVNNPDQFTFEYNVDKPPGHELEETGLAERALRDLAELSGGKFYREEDLHLLVSDIQQQYAVFSPPPMEKVGWSSLALLVLFSLCLVLLTGEWLVRKFSNLS